MIRLVLVCLPAAGSTPISFDLLQRHLIVVRGATGPLEGLKLLIDTGTIPTIVDRGVAKKLALDIQEREFVAFGQKTRVGSTVLPEIRFGSLRANGVREGVGNLSFLNGVDAIVGLDVLSVSTFTIDYQHHLLGFGPVVLRDAGVRLELTPPFLTVRVIISGQPLRVLVDTGSGRLVLFERRVHDRLPPPSVHGELLLNHLSGTSRLNRVSLTSLEVGGSSIKCIEGFMSDAPLDGYPLDIDGVLGLLVIAGKRADFDFERNRLAFAQ